MIVHNKTSFNIFALCWHRHHGPGERVEIGPNESAEIRGPYLGEMGDGDCWIAMEGEITCHEGLDDNNGLHVSKGNKLDLGLGDKGVTVFHCCEDYTFARADD